MANIYLHYVFDRIDAERFLEQLRDRLAKFGLELHPDKTRLIEFGRHAISNRRQRGEGKPETFAFLGFTHICEKNRNTGYFVVRRKTMRQRMVAKLKAVNQQLRQRRHDPTAKTGERLRAVVQGWFNYHAVPGNGRTLSTFRRRVIRLWRQQIRLRSQKARWNWKRFGALVERYLPTPRILHPFPSVRFDAMHPR